MHYMPCTAMACTNWCTSQESTNTKATPGTTTPCDNSTALQCTAWCAEMVSTKLASTLHRHISNSADASQAAVMLATAPAAAVPPSLMSVHHRGLLMVIHIPRMYNRVALQNGTMPSANQQCQSLIQNQPAVKPPPSCQHPLSNRNLSQP